MAQWKLVADLEDVTSLLTDLDGGLLSNVSDGLEVVQDIVETAGALIGTLAAFLQAVDPLSAALAGIIAILESAVNATLESDIYVFPMLPTQPSALIRPYTIESGLHDMIRGLQDRGDSQRPTTENFGAESAFAGVVLAFGADNWKDFSETLRIFGRLFDGSEANKWAKLADLRLKFDEFVEIPRAERGAQGVPWDWTRTNWLTQLGLGAQLDALKAQLNALKRASVGLVRTIEQAENILARRLAYIQRLLAEIADIIQFITDIKDLIPELWTVQVSGATGGVSQFAQSIIGAGNRPPFKLSAGVVVGAFTVNPEATFEAISNLIGMQLNAFEQIVVEA